VIFFLVLYSSIILIHFPAILPSSLRYPSLHSSHHPPLSLSISLYSSRTNQSLTPDLNPCVRHTLISEWGSLNHPSHRSPWLPLMPPPLMFPDTTLRANSFNIISLKYLVRGVFCFHISLRKMMLQISYCSKEI
jgi:hypothetical protein